MGEQIPLEREEGRAAVKGTRFVLVRPRSPGNVGSVARAMKNFGFKDLVLVDPRLNRDHDKPGSEPYFEAEARRMAWHAVDVLDSAATTVTLAEAAADRRVVLATSPHPKNRIENLSPEEGVKRLAGAADDAALVFGSESSGLTLAELSVCDGVIVIPTDPGYRDLNLAQSAVLLGYLLYRALERPAPPAKPARASSEEIERLAAVMEEAGLTAGFFQQEDDAAFRELRASLHRWGLTAREAGMMKSMFRRIIAKAKHIEIER